MKISKKAEYAVKIMLYLMQAENYRDRPTVGEDLQISTHNAKKILVCLKRAKLVKSIRGRRGGYELSASPDTIQLRTIFRAIGEADMEQEAEVNHEIEEASPLGKEVSQLYDILQEQLDKPMEMTLKDFADIRRQR